MKYLGLTAIFAVALTLASCKKRHEITYPDSGPHGVNILAGDGTFEADPNTNYSFTAECGKKADLKIVITNLSVPASSTMPKPVWYYGAMSLEGWHVNDYYQDQQSFEAERGETNDLSISFGGNGEGHCRIDFYENSDDITRTKYVSW